MSVVRRSFLSLLSVALVAPTIVGATSPWEPRRLNPSERDLMERFQKRLSLKIPEASKAIQRLEDHVALTLSEDQLFRTGTAELHQDGVRLLTLVAEVMMVVRVRTEAVAHHHSDGQSYRSFIISQRRATAITAALESRKVRRDLLLATGLGGNFPIATNSTDLGRAQNRRVDLVFRPA